MTSSPRTPCAAWCARRCAGRETTGLPGEHHFYIAFNTKYPGVDIGERMAQRYPREMTIVLQHQYWNLKVHDDRFEVELSFDNIPEKLVIPFNAVKGFLDPCRAVRPAVRGVTVEPPVDSEAKLEKPASAKTRRKTDGPEGDASAKDPQPDGPESRFVRFVPQEMRRMNGICKFHGYLPPS